MSIVIHVNPKAESVEIISFLLTVFSVIITTCTGFSLWNVVRDFIALFSFIKIWYENNAFFGLIKLSFPKVILLIFKVFF